MQSLLTLPEFVDLFGGNLTSTSDRRNARHLAGDDVVTLEAILARLEQLRAELAGPAPTAVERLLAERAASCWLGVSRAEFHLASAGVQNDHAQRSLDRANKRYLSVLATLARVRKLAAPAVIIGKAGQVTVNSPAAPT
jgi:hypothetical protein